MPVLSISTILAALITTCISPTSALTLQNMTIALPSGSTDHNTPGLLCTPTRPTDILLFYLLNYVAHAATVLVRPGERADDYFVSVLGSLMFPALGLYRGIEAILCGAVFVRKDDLRKAARSGALCCVVRAVEWRPVVDGERIPEGAVYKEGNTAFRNIQDGKEEEGDEGQEKKNDKSRTVACEDVEIGESEKDTKELHIIPFSPPWLFSKFGCPVYVHRRIVHGSYTLPEGYRFAILPHDARFVKAASVSTTQQQPQQQQEQQQPPIVEVSATYNMVKALIALAQSVYALMTLYRARGDQISQFGYAAFGLTVAPYAVMSSMNLVGSLCRPEYPSLYMVESSMMDEARRRGGSFEGAVARVEEEPWTRGCTCEFERGADVDELRFYESQMNGWEAQFRISNSSLRQSDLSTVKPKDYNGPSTSTDLEPSISLSSTHPSTSHLTRQIAPIPKKLDYRFTKGASLIFIPCHPPISRSHESPSPEEAPNSLHHPPITALTLRRTWPFLKHRTWTPTFAPSPSRTRALRWRLTKYLLTSLISLIPLLLIGLLSGFKPGSIPSTELSTWRTFVVQWLCIGVFTGLWFVVDQERKEGMGNAGAQGQLGPVGRALVYFTSSAPAVGGFVVVGEMVARYGVCVWVGS